MGDVYFRCLGCQQSLVADESGAGVSFRCPHCNTSQTIPTAQPSVSPTTLKEDEKSATGRRPQASSDGNLWVAQERLWKNQHQTAEQAVALVERDQRISALRAECDWLTSQLDEERRRRQALEPELDLARGQWAAAEKRAVENEASFSDVASRLDQAEMAVKELTHQLDLVKSERSEAVLDLARQQETFAELNLELEKARSERAEMEQILGRARGDLDRTASELAAAESAAELSAAEAGEIKASLAQLRGELGVAVTDRDKLQALVREDRELFQYVETKTERDRIEAELRETQARLDGFREKIEALTTEREALLRERTDLQLKIAALRDAHDDTQLQQDNEVLRRMVERLNEELKEVQPELARRKRNAAPGGVGGIARAALSRCFVSNPNAADGR